MCLNASCVDMRYIWYALQKGPWHTHLFLCGNVEVALTEVKEKVLVDLPSHGVARSLAVHIWLLSQVYLDRKWKGNTVRHKVLNSPILLPSGETESLKGKKKKDLSREKQQIRRQLHLEDFPLVVPQEGNGVIILHSDSHSGQKARLGQHCICL